MLELSPKDTIHLCSMSPASLCFLASWQVKYMADEGEFHGRDLLEAVFSAPGGWVVAGAKRANICSLWSFNTKMLPFVTINIYNWKDEWQMDDTLKIREETQQRRINFNSYIDAFHYPQNLHNSIFSDPSAARKIISGNVSTKNLHLNFCFGCPVTSNNYTYKGEILPQWNSFICEAICRGPI